MQINSTGGDDDEGRESQENRSEAEGDDPAAEAGMTEESSGLVGAIGTVVGERAAATGSVGEC